MIKHDIKHRITGAVIFSADIDCAEDAPSGIKLGLAVKAAVAAGANLAGANLAGAYLAGANLADANLADAYLAGAYLAGANLADAYLADPADVPVVENIDAAILAAIAAGGTLDMGVWHICETTHCRAGWAIHLAGEAGRALEEKYGPFIAGSLIYAASRPGVPPPHFFASTDAALADIRACAAKQTGAKS